MLRRRRNVADYNLRADMPPWKAQLDVGLAASLQDDLRSAGIIS